MSRIPLLGGAYTDRSPIASGQETINLYPERNINPNAPAQVTHYLFPGSRIFGTPATENNTRCTYTTSIGTCYAVIGVNVYVVSINGAMTFIGAIPDRESQVIMADNGLVAVLVDGVDGFVIDLATNAFGQIVDAAFYGANYVTFLDTFFVFNRPNTNQFYISLSMVDFAMLTGGTAFDPLDIAAKSGSADNIVGIVAVHKELWLIGALTTEIWVGTGAADFYFQQVQGAYIEFGCLAPFSIAYTDVMLFWIMKNKQGQFQIMKGAGYQVENIATSYIIEQMSRMESVSDVIASIFQVANHSFYVINFPTANITFVYDITTGEFVRAAFLDVNTGNLNRYRYQCFTAFNGQVLGGDWENGKLYTIDPNIYVERQGDGDSEGPILRRKTFIHMVGGEFERVNYITFDADIDAGTTDITQADVDNNLATEPKINLFWSDDRGKTYGNPVEQGFGLQGEYLTTISWNRLGQARDRLFKLEWSADLKTSLLGGFATVRTAKT